MNRLNNWQPAALLIYLVLFAGGALLIVAGFTAREALAARAWPTAEGWVSSASVVEYPSGEDGAPLYAADVHYFFYIGEQIYRGTRIRLDDRSSPDRAAAEAVAARYSRGQQVIIHYNPRSPAQALLEPGFPAGLWLPAGLGAFLTLAGAGLAAGRFLRRSA
jgi:hypothetical protein